MRKFVCVGALVLGLCLVAAAADNAPTAQVFGGVSWLHVDNMGVGGFKTNYMGWDAEFQFNVKKWLGATGDVSGHYGHITPDLPLSHTYTFLGGPTLSIRGQNSTLFVHTLFGGNNTNLFSGGGSSASNTAFAMAWGGGIDLRVNHTFAVRLGQLDWLYTRHNLKAAGLRDHQNNVRYAGGIVINFGGH